MVVRGWIERGAAAPADAERDLLVAQLEATEALRRRVEQEYVAKSDWNYYSRAGQLQDDMGRLYALLGDDAAAEAAWREQPLRRTPYGSSAFGSWRSDWQVRYAAENWLGLGAPDKALRALGTEFLLRESPPDRKGV